MSDVQFIFVAAEVTRLKSSDFQNEPPHVGCDNPMDSSGK